MNVRDALLQRIQSRMVRTRTALERFDDVTAVRMLLGLRWNVRDLVGHLAYWTSEGADEIPRLAAGGKKKDYDIDRINEEVFQANRRMSFVMILPQLREAEERFLAAVKSVEPKLLADDTPVRQWIDGVGIDHYDAHKQDLQAAVERLA